MGFASAYSAQPELQGAHLVTVEADITSKTLYAFSLVGLPDKAVEESRDRVAAAIKNSGLTSPKSQNQKTVISLAPADLKKEGPVFDLSVAVAYLIANKVIQASTGHRLFLGELALDGRLRPIHGVLPIARTAAEAGFAELFVPRENAHEAALITEVTVYPVSTLAEVLAHINEKDGDIVETLGNETLTPQPPTPLPEHRPSSVIALEDIKGQENAKRGVEIAAAGGHNIALTGPPGTGKSMLAKALPGILPQLSFEEMLEVTAIHSSAGESIDEIHTHPPLRAPHHTASYASIVGGGSHLSPGEVTLAHRGILFLDEFPEFDRRVINSLREPLEERKLKISRSAGSATFPADIMLIAACNPCPCGKYGTDQECTCAPHHVIQYRRKFAGPVADRIDLWLDVPQLDQDTLSQPGTGEATETVRARVQKARSWQEQRYADKPAGNRRNSHLGAREVDEMLSKASDATNILSTAVKKHKLSPRAYHRLAKLARTIADLDASENIYERHMLEALQYRSKAET